MEEIIMKQKKECYTVKNSIIAFSLNAIFLLLVIFFCDMKYEVSDDFIMDAILSGGWGTAYNEHLLFSNILYGYFLKFLYELFPVVSWYFVSHIAICFFSLWAVTYIILEKNNRYVGITISIIFISFFSDDLYILPQFTKTAAVATCAGGALFLLGIWDIKKKRWKCILLGVVLALVGTMIRMGNMYIALAYLLLMFLKYVWEMRASRKIFVHIIAAILACGALVGGAYFLQEINKEIWYSDSGYKNYRLYNSMRASITDVNSYGYESIQSELEALGLNLTDFYMFESWNFLDENYYSRDLLGQVSEIKKLYSESVTHSLENSLKDFINRGYHRYIVAMGIAVLLAFMLFLNPKMFCWEIVELGITGLLLLYFFYRGRVVYRVEYSIFVSMGISLATAFRVSVVEEQIKKVFVYWSVVFCLCKIPLYIPDKNYVTMTQEEYTQYIYDTFYESWNFKLEKYRCNVSAREPYKELIDYIEADSENYYLFDFSSSIQLIYYNYKPWIRRPIGYYNNYSYIGGVTSGFPENYTLWEKHGIDARNPYKSLVNDNIHIVDNIHHFTKENYLKEHYYPSARMELVDEIDDFCIWKFYEQ